MTTRQRRSQPAVGVTGVLLAALGVCVSAAQDEPRTSTRDLVPEDKGYGELLLAVLRDRGIQTHYAGNALDTLGMPCGGICAGQLYVRGDGTLACWQIDGENYFNGYGQNNYRTERPDAPLAQGFTLTAWDQDSQKSAPLSRDAYDAIVFTGEYPRATVHYGTRTARTPQVRVSLEVFSPFIPLDARNSAWPATVLTFTVANPNERAVTVRLDGHLQNGVFSRLTEPVGLRRRNRVVMGDNVTSVLMDAVPEPISAEPVERVIADFETGTYAGWTVTGTAFGDAPARGTNPKQQEVSGFGGTHLVNSYANPGLDTLTGRMRSEPFVLDLPYLTFKVGGGRHAGQTCVNLIVDEQVVRSATGRNDEQLEVGAWDVRAWAGASAQIEIVDEHTGAWGHINVDDIVLANVLPPALQFSEDALGYGTMALSVIGAGTASADHDAGQAVESAIESDDFGPLVGSVGVAFELAPEASRDVTFIVSWHFPNLHTGHGRMYTNWYTDARDVAVKLTGSLDELHAQTRLFCNTYYRASTLPWWLITRLMMPVANLATGTAQWWKDGRFWAYEGVCCCHGTCTHVWNYAQAHAWLFPELARSARTMQDLGQAFDQTSGLVGFRSDRAFAADGQAGTVLKCYREHLTTADDTFLRAYWPRIKLALECLIDHDLDEDGIIENHHQHNTYDINFVGPNTFVGSLYLAALRAGEAMAREVGDRDAAERYRRIFERGRDWTAANLFNGAYFEQRVPEHAGTRFQYGTGCLSDQVFGQTWAHLLDLGYVYPQEMVRAALTAVYRCNWTPDVGALYEVFPPERYFARAGEPGLFVCTWPRGGRYAEPVRYRDEVWTGIEYQVAAGLIWEGAVDEGLTIVRGIERRYDGTKHNPWNEVECGDHYARALASWGVLHALTGFRWHGPEGRLSFAPRLKPDDFVGFFCTGTSWGTLQQRRTPDAQANGVELAYGELRVAQLVVETRIPFGPDQVVVQARDRQWRPRTLPHAATIDGPRAIVTLDEPLVLRAGEKLEMTFTANRP